MRIRTAVAAVLLAASCARHDAGIPPSSTGTNHAFLLWALQATSSEADLGAVATKRAYEPATRALGQQLAREQAAMHADLVKIAGQRGVTIPAQIDEKRAALKENLLILPGQVFDRGFTLAIAQDTSFMLQGFDKTSSDPALRDLAARYRPVVLQQQKAFTQILDRIGGSPFGYAPEAGAAAPF